jgi:SAM-dependent methyltransferase
MGLCYWDARTLWDARLRDVSFTDTLTIGHQSLFLHPREVRQFRDAFNARFPDSPHRPLESYTFGMYADEFLHAFLDARSVSILDVSDYEGATILHDLNQPIPDSLRNSFDAVVDGGSLEHVFNFPTAVANIMQLVKVGGSVFISTPANNLCGHGFYQFSPELMFRVFTEDNGFRLRDLKLHEATFPSVELRPARRAYAVADPLTVRRRVGLMSKRAATMIVEAEKVADVPPFASSPLQSDYLPLWGHERARAVRTDTRTLLRRVHAAMPPALRAAIAGYREKRLFSLANTRFYRRL